ncbi:MAG: glycosyltransferase [Myxococcota bacterium]
MRLLMYSQDGAGLGHLRRAGNIAQEVLARAPASDVLVMSDSPATPLLPALQGLDYLKLPTIVKSGRLSSETTSWRSSTLSLGIEQTLKLRTKLIDQTFSEFRPDVLLIDHMPLGALGELGPMLERASRCNPRPRLYLGLRDILDAPEVIRRAWDESGAYDSLRRYDGILIYGCSDMYDAAEAYDLSRHADHLTYCNYVGPNPKTIPRVRQSPTNGKFRSEGEHLLLVMCGGGADAFRMAEVFLQALPALTQSARIRAVILTGPNMDPAERSALRDRPSTHPVEVLSLSDDVPSLIERASLVVTMGGYNSVCEVVDAGKKALVVPRRGPSAEQRIRGRVFADRGLVRAVDPDGLEPSGLAAELVELLKSDGVPDPSAVPPLDGAQRAADILLGSHSGRSS